MKISYPRKIILVSVLVLALLGPILAPFAEGFNFPDRYDLVAVLVEQGLYGDTNDYDGLAGIAAGPVSRTNLKTRVDRYAADLQVALPGTRAIIIQADRFEDPANIAAVLERLYSEGDPEETGRTAYLRGVVAVGEVPLPVVNKQGNRFISLYPYTDFEQKAYLWNPATRDFEPNKKAPKNPQPEIWHGVIRPPVSTQTPQGKQMLAAYFDKNHLYHLGDDAYAAFGKRVFYQDFADEFKNLGAESYKNYLNFLAHQDDVAYMRYTKELYKDLAGPVEEGIAQDQAEAAQLAADLEAEGIPMDRNVPKPSLPADAPQAVRDAVAGRGPEVDKNKISDIMTKVAEMSDKLMSRFNDLFTKYPNLINDYIGYTGRYTHLEDRVVNDLQVKAKIYDVDSAVNLITAKDKHAGLYLKAVNEMVEAKIDEIVARASKSHMFADVRIQVDSLTSKIAFPPPPLPGTTTIPAEFGTVVPVEFVNYTPAFNNGAGGNFPDRLNGWQMNEVTGVAQCTPYRGSNSDQKYSKLVETGRQFDSSSSADQDPASKIVSGRTPAEKEDAYLCRFNGARETCEGYEHFAGCFYNADGNKFASAAQEPGAPQICFSEHATDPVFIASGTRRIEDPPRNFDNFNFCPRFLEKSQYIEYLKSVDSRLEILSNGGYEWDGQQKVAQAQGVRLAASEKHPDSITLFDFELPLAPLPNPMPGFAAFRVTLGDVLRGLGWNSAADSEGWRGILEDLLTSPTPPAERSVRIQHNLIDSVKFSLSRVFEKQSPSVIFHKEPTIDTLAAQTRSMVADELPVDNPRYVTFQTLTGNVAKIVYPDLFKEQSIDAYVEKLREIENQLNALPREQGEAMPCRNCLADLVSNAPETAAALDTPEAKAAGINLRRANRSKVLDAISWKNMDVDAKHLYLLQYYLDPTPAKNAYVGESLNGYELAYLNGEGDAEGYEFSLNKEGGGGGGEEDGAYNDGNDGAAALGGENQVGEEPEEGVCGSGPYAICNWDPPPASPWWEKMKEWEEGLEQTQFPVSFGESEESFYGKMEEENKKELEKIKEESSKVESDPKNADSVELSKIKKIELVAESLVAATARKADVQLLLKDKDGNLVDGEFAKATLELESVGAEASQSAAQEGEQAGDQAAESAAEPKQARFSSDIKDDDPTRPGVQITLMSGKKTIGIVMPDNPVAVKLRAKLDDTELAAEISLAAVTGARLVLQAPVVGVVADGRQRIEVSVFAWDDKNQVITGANGIVNLGVSDVLKGQIVEDQVVLREGRAVFHFKAGKKAGKAVINAATGAIESGQLELSLLPGPPYRIVLASESDTVPVSPGSQTVLRAALFDANGNAVDTNSAVQINFRITEATSRFGTLSSMSETVQNGVAETILFPRPETGVVHVVAESHGLVPGAVSVKFVKKFGKEEVQAMQPEALAVALLGIPAGNVAEENYLGGWFVMNGKTQAANSLTTFPKQYKKLAEVNGNGGLLLDTSRISAHFLPANNFTMVLRDNRSQRDLAHVSIFTLKEGQFEVTDIADSDKLADGIYVRKTAQAAAYDVDRVKGALRVTKDDADGVEIQTNGFLRIFDNDFSVMPVNGKFLTLQVLDKGTPVAEILFVQRFNQDARIILRQAQDDNQVQGDINQLNAPGAYFKPLMLPPQYLVSRSFIGNSSANPRSAALYDKTEVVSGGGAPGFAFKSLEDSLSGPGVGFTDDNKFALLFSSGETFGEANKPFASDAGIVLGDPSVRINNKKAGGFSADVGKFLYAAGGEVRGIIGLDYNNDNFEDIFIVQGDGKIRLFQNNGGYDQLKDQGFIIDIKSGIQDLTKLDYNNDGQMDLVIAGRTSCRKGDSCIDIYENNAGAFTRRNLRIDQTEKIVTLRAEDMNADGSADLVFADAAGDIKILYNRRGAFDVQPQTIGNVGLRIDPANNLVAGVLINYPGMDSKNPEDPNSVLKYKTFSVKVPNPGIEGEISGGPAGAEVVVDEPVTYVEKDFVYADLDPAFARSTKFAEDLNGEVVKAGDVIRYTITLQNDSGVTKQNVAVSDVVGEQVALDKDSVKCEDCAEGDLKVEPLDADQTRPFLFKGIRVPANSVRHIVYEAKFKGDTGSADKINFVFNNRFIDADAGLQARLQADNYPDISVTKAGNPTGRVRYYYTTGVDGSGNLTWDSELSSPVTDTSLRDAQTQAGIETVDKSDLSDPAVVAAQQAAAAAKLKGLQTGDSDGDGLPDSIDDLNGRLDELAGDVSNAVSKLTCNAGCIAMPLNIALFAPGPWSLLGAPIPFDFGLPVFGWGTPYPPFFTFGSAATFSALGGRFYVSPTLTGGVGFSVCMGPFGTPKNCYSFGINVLDLLPGNICDTINGAVSGAMSKAGNAIGKLNEGVTVALGGEGKGNAAARDSGGSGLLNYSLGSYTSPVSTSRNIRVPGFPSMVTDWFTGQLEEITDKALSLPDIYLIYPSWDSIAGSFKFEQGFKGMSGDIITNILSYLNSMPILDIKTQEVLFKVPMITRKEIERLKADSRQWLKDEILWLNQWTNIMGCHSARAESPESAAPAGISEEIDQLCAYVEGNMNRLISAVGQNMRALDEWILFPKKLLQYRMITSFYIRQIIDYLDQIMQFIGGWTKKNTAIVKQWRKSIRTMKQTIEDWKALYELMIEYNEDCDECKTERYSLKDLILKLFMAVPSPPIIPMPKLPDIIIDVSKVQAGLTLQFPDVKFKPEPLKIPKLPRITIGVKVNMEDLPPWPEIGVIPSPPELPTLKALPQLNLAKLPDLPPPPTLPCLPDKIKKLIKLFEKIVKILCIIRKGFLPTDELLLKTRIEEITARGLSPVLPIDLLFTMTSPTISVTYIDLIKITAFSNLQFDTAYIQEAVEKVAAKANKFTTNLMKEANKGLEAIFKQIEKYTNPTFDLDVSKEGVDVKARPMNYLEENELRDVLSQTLGIDATELVDAGMEFREGLRSLAQQNEDYKFELTKVPDKLMVVASNEPYRASARMYAPKSQGRESADGGLPLGRLQAYRDSLAAYVADSEKGLNSAQLADSQIWRQFSVPSLGRYLVQAGLSDASAESEPQQVKIGEVDSESSRMLAYAMNPPSLNVPGMENSPAAAGGSVNNKGIFFIDVNGETKRLVDYTLEAEGSVQLADSDMDNDGDSEKIYSYGSNVFIKKNERRADNDDRPTFRPVDMEFKTVFELLPKGMSVNSADVLSESSHEASFNFEKPVMEDVAGYEVIAKNSPYFFERAGDHKTIRAHLMPESLVADPQELAEELVLKEADGEVLVNGSVPLTMTAKIGDYVLTGDNSSVVAEASDGTRIRVSENTVFMLSKGKPFELEQGEIEISLPESGGLLFAPSTEIGVKKGSIRLRFFDGSELLLKDGQKFTLPAISKVIALLGRVAGSVQFTGIKRDYVSDSAGRVRVLPGEILHPMEISELVWDSGGKDEKTLTLSKDILLTVPDSAGSGMFIEAEDGMVEVIRSGQSSQPAAAGMALDFGDQLLVQRGYAIVHYSRGGDTTLRANETYILNKIENADSPIAKLTLDPAFYFAKIRAFDSQGNRSNSSEKLLLAPQICGDNTPPVANLGKAEFTIAVGKTMMLDASRSFDSQSNIISYFLDTDSDKDSDGDGIANNDRDVFKDKDSAADSDEDGNPANDGDLHTLVIGPYEEVGQKKMRLTVRDEALNEGYQDIVVNIVTPRIVLEGPPLKSNVISGFVEPPEDAVPITIAKLRQGTSSAGWEIFKTPSADAGGQYYTDSVGKFRITDADLRDRLVVRNSENKIVAEINPETGRTTITDERYEMRVMPNSPPNQPTRIGIFPKSDQSMDNPLTYTYFVPDVNTDAVIDGPDVEYNKAAISRMSGVRVKPLPRAQEFGLVFSVLPGSDTQIPGAAVVAKGETRVAAFDVNGDIFIHDKAVKLLVKPGAADDPVVFEMYYDNQLVAEIFIAAHTGAFGRIQIVDAPKLTPRPKPKPKPTLKKEFSDVSKEDSLSAILDKLSERGIVSGYPSDVKGELLFKPDNLINRAEFTQIAMKMLCIVPRPEAHKLPTPFYDVLDPKLWFYPVLKEGNIRGFIKGYVGEKRTDADGVARTPFKPANQITRAEAATIVLAALYEENIIDLSKADLKAKQGEQWYAPYLRVAKDLKPYLVNTVSGERAFLLTEEEARNPDKQISRGEFAIMADRVLLIYDCFKPDSDKDGLLDAWELQYVKDVREMDPNGDLDGDTCPNAREYEMKTDPTKQDTDNGGVADCEEANSGRDPNNPYDDLPQAPAEISRNEEGLFVLRPDCGNVCPCRATIGEGADLMPQDTLFAAITGPGGLPIYAKSNEETY